MSEHKDPRWHATPVETDARQLYIEVYKIVLTSWTDSDKADRIASQAVESFCKLFKTD